MATEKLTALQVRKQKEVGRYGDGGGLYLQVGKTGTKSWLFRYQFEEKQREMGLGPYPAVSLAQARQSAAEQRKVLAGRKDPLVMRGEAEAEAARLKAAQGVTFKQCAEAYISAHESSWHNPKHRQQWRNTLATYAYPILGELPVSAIDTSLVVQALEPIWPTKTETASRLRGRIEAILDWAKVRGHRQGENPAQWRGHLDKVLPKRSKARRVKHHRALSYTEIPAFMAELRAREGLTALAMEFAILTGSRTNEVLGAAWREFDLPERVWIVPAERMKNKRPHRVPLTARCLEILEKAMQLKQEGSDFVFPGQKKGRPLSNMVFLQLLKRMERLGKSTAHGFRSTLRDWISEQTNFPNIVAEAALAHVVADKVEAAYRRGDMFEKRRKLMEAWAAYCLKAPAPNRENIVAIGVARATAKA